MKQLAVLVFLLALIGIAGFLYRNALERPLPPDSVVTACTLEAKVCPDGSSVGRQGPDCAFAACPLPNKELPGLGVSFAIPAGFAENPDAPTPGDDLVIAFEKPSLAPQVPHAIVIRRYPIPEGQTAEQVMVANTIYDTSGEPVAGIGEFTAVTLNGRTFQSLTVDRFEAQVHTVYYLPRANDVLRFEVLERDVVEWTEPSLVINDLPEHAAFLRMLGTLQVR